MKRICIAVPETQVSDSIKVFLEQQGFVGEVIPYVQGIIPTLTESHSAWEGLVLSMRIFKEPATEKALEFIRWIRQEKRLSSIHILLLCDLPEDDPFLSELIYLGVYNILNGRSLSLSDIHLKLQYPNTYADVQHFLAAPIRNPAKRKPSFDLYKETPESAILERTITIRQKLYAFVSFYPAGSTLLSMNLAETISSGRGQTVALWDADSRHPAQFYSFGLDYEFLMEEQAIEAPSFIEHPIKSNFRLYTWMPNNPPPIANQYFDIYPSIREGSDICIVDFSGDLFSPTTELFLKQANHIFIILDPNPFQWIVKSKQIQTFIKDYGVSKCQLVLNRCSGPVENLSRLAITLFGKGADYIFPELRSEHYTSFLKGRPLVSDLEASHPFKMALEAMVNMKSSTTKLAWYQKIWRKR
jgi:cellulose biosynthesis protein BcsQ